MPFCTAAWEARHFSDVRFHVYKYPETIDRRTGKRIDASYEYEVHLCTNDEKERNVNIQYYSNWDIEDVEKNIEEIFATGKWAYYEK